MAISCRRFCSFGADTRRRYPSISSLAGVLHAVDVVTGTPNGNSRPAVRFIPLHHCLETRFFSVPMTAKCMQSIAMTEQDMGAPDRSGGLGISGHSNRIVFFGSADGRVYAVEASSGAATMGHRTWRKNLFHDLCQPSATLFGMWRRQSILSRLFIREDIVEHADWERIDSSPAVVGDLVLIGSEDFFFYAMNATSGEVRWKYETGLGIASSPAIQMT